MIKLAGISGSLRSQSYSFKALSLTLKQAEGLGVEVEILDLRTLNLPFCNGEDDYADYPDVGKLRQAVQQSDGLILVTPEYHGGVSGVLKNALDLLSSEHLSGKVTGAISVLGGQANSNALNQLRLITRWVHAVMVPEQIAIGQAWQAFDNHGNLQDEKLSERLDKFVESMVTMAAKLRSDAADK